MWVHVKGRHSLRDGGSVTSCSILECVAAFDGAWVSDVREEISLDHDFGTSLVRTRGRGQALQDWLRVVAEKEARVDEVDTIERYLDGQGDGEVRVGRRVAYDTHGGEESSSHDLVSNLAVGDDSVLELLIEPSA